MKLTRHRVLRIIFLLACVLVALGIIRSVVTIWEKRGIVAERKAVLTAEETKRADLTRQLRDATSAAFIERAAREKLGLVREGETVVIMDQTQASGSGASGISEDVPSWKQWWKLFF